MGEVREQLLYLENTTIPKANRLLPHFDSYGTYQLIEV